MATLNRIARRKVERPEVQRPRGGEPTPRFDIALRSVSLRRTPEESSVVRLRDSRRSVFRETRAEFGRSRLAEPDGRPTRRHPRSFGGGTLSQNRTANLTAANFEGAHRRSRLESETDTASLPGDAPTLPPPVIPLLARFAPRIGRAAVRHAVVRASPSNASGVVRRRFSRTRLVGFVPNRPSSRAERAPIGPFDEPRYRKRGRRHRVGALSNVESGERIAINPTARYKICFGGGFGPRGRRDLPTRRFGVEKAESRACLRFREFRRETHESCDGNGARGVEPRVGSRDDRRYGEYDTSKMTSTL